MTLYKVYLYISLQLNNSEWWAKNYLGNFIETQTGSPVVTNFKTALNAVAGEMATLFKQTGGTDVEISSWKNNISAANSPEQLSGAIDTMLGLMATRLSVINEKYKSAFH